MVVVVGCQFFTPEAAACLLSSTPSYVSTVPNPVLEAAVHSTEGLLKSGLAKTGSVDKASFMSLKSFPQACIHTIFCNVCYVGHNVIKPLYKPPVGAGQTNKGLELILGLWGNSELLLLLKGQVNKSTAHTLS